jgi:hypothetical protein
MVALQASELTPATARSGRRDHQRAGRRATEAPGLVNDAQHILGHRPHKISNDKIRQLLDAELGVGAPMARSHYERRIRPV